MFSLKNLSLKMVAAKADFMLGNPCDLSHLAEKMYFHTHQLLLMYKLSLVSVIPLLEWISGYIIMVSHIRSRKVYSPNLNPIERLWKVMNELSKSNIYFSTKAEFTMAINQFFNVMLAKIAGLLVSRITDSFQILKTASSS